MARLPIGEPLDFASRSDWEEWLDHNHASAREGWVRLAKKDSGAIRVSRADALEVALSYGWIDGQSAAQDDRFWLQRFTPRTRRSKWSQINCVAVEKLIQEGKMKPAGLAAVEAARADGRWDAAYAPPSRIEVPVDLLEHLAQNPAAEMAFRSLNAQNRYAILHRIHDAKRAETRARRIEKFVAMLERGETIH